MSLYAIELNDAALAGVGEAGLAFGDRGFEPGYAAEADGRVLFGAEALHQARLNPRSTTNRFWSEFSDEPLARPIGPYESSVDLVHAHLERLLKAFPDRPSEVLLAVPHYWTTRQLGLLLGLAEELALPVRGLVDSGVAATRCEYSDQHLLHLDAGLHDLSVISMGQDGGASLQDRQTITEVSILRLERACAGFIAEKFLRATRLDPLHDASNEQFLYDSLYTWLAELNLQDEIGVTIDFSGNEFRTTIRRDELAQRVAGAFEPAVRMVRSSVGPEDRVALQITSRLAVFPGVIEALTGLPQANLYALEPAAAATGALQRAAQFSPSGDGVGLTTKLAWDRPAVGVAETEPSVRRAREIVEPTHLLHDGVVYRLGTAAFNVGAELPAGEYGLRLGSSLSGISRRHCSVRRGAKGVELVDHSRFGTQLNGHSISGAAILQAGDVISIGSPAIELRLVREVSMETDADGA
ncbi:MAG: FHA domain-containing protein [Gammaproteobacteria bacterium]